MPIKPPPEFFFDWDDDVPKSELSRPAQSRNTNSGVRRIPFVEHMEKLANKAPDLKRALGVRRAAQIVAMDIMDATQGQIIYEGLNTDPDDDDPEHIVDND